MIVTPDHDSSRTVLVTPRAPVGGQDAAATLAGAERTGSAPARNHVAGGSLHSRWHGDLVLVVVSALATFALSGYFDLAESLRRLTRPYEYIQLDELPVVLLTAALGLVWFGWRRYREARRELAQRQEVEIRLAATLDEKSRLARRFIDAQEAERRNLARELHDELGQYLNAIKLDAVAVGSRLTHEPLRGRTQSIVESVDHVHRVVQMMIRRFRPVALDELGLRAALEHSMDRWQRRMPGTTLQLDATGDLEHCGEPANLAVYRMVQEGLTNISRHARATRVRIRLGRHVSPRTGREVIQLAIDDDGVGTDLRTRSSGLGLVGMRERAEILGGEFHVASKPDQGFSLSATLPVMDAAVEPAP